jgi:hypothetical protein
MDYFSTFYSLFLNFSGRTEGNHKNFGQVSCFPGETETNPAQCKPVMLPLDHPSRCKGGLINKKSVA